ncbi:MAG: exo-alpha-sialidase [Planctomycetes bacterium]|nr:exo-alpha-sialidase [Planctomycetota bacterium]
MSDRIWVGTKKGIFEVERGAGGWRIVKTHFLADDTSMFLSDPRSGTLLAALDHGHFGAKMHRSGDGGKTWQEVGVPEYPPQPDGEVEKDNWGKPWAWKLIRVWALEPGHKSQPGVIWCGTLPGGLFRSRDNGATWQIIDTLWNNPMRKGWFGGGADYPGIHSVCVDPRDGRHVHVGVSCGGVWATEDDGQTWNCRADGMRAAYMPPEKAYEPNIQDPHIVVQCPARPEAMWAQHHNGIFRTTDGAKSWQEIKEAGPSVFGFAVAVHPRNPDLAWFVPAQKDEKRIPVDGKVVVTRTRDGGKTFEVLRNGLPQDHAYDLVYRHALAIDETGDRLVFGSTTGSCWISENQGDSWSCLSTHLPPIRCIKFG